MAPSRAEPATARRPVRRSGFSLIELLAALTILALLSAVLFGLLLAQLRLARLTADRALGNDAVRSTLSILTGELRRAVPSDVRALAEDSLAVRSFRGLALVCSGAYGAYTVAYRGDRLPDPRKDSVLVVRPPVQRAVALLGTGPADDDAECAARADDELVLRFSLGDGAASADGASALLVFESGRYFLTGRALRYRLGAEGRQPLTAEMFRHPGTAFLPPRLYGGLGLSLTVEGRPLRLHTAPFAPPPSR